jgi:pimeloyl-ACP methyl ester carboxylesterase
MGTSSVRRRVVAVGGALTVAAIGVGVSRLRRRREPAVVADTFPNGMGYLRFGSGVRSLLWIPDPFHSGHVEPRGGPGGGVPKSGYLVMMTRMLRSFVESGYTIFLVGPKPNLPPGCTLADMAEDYAGLIVEEFGGKVDLVVGDSGGGMIGFCLAAQHPELFAHIAIVVAGHTQDEAYQAADLESARLNSAGRRTDAAAVMINAMFPGLRPPFVARLLASVMGRVLLPAGSDDLVVAAEALSAFDGREILPTIPVPVLLVCGDRDKFVPKEVYEQTAELIPDCTLKLYEGKDHLGALFDKRTPGEILEFARP